MFTSNSMTIILNQLCGKTTSSMASSAYLALSQTAPTAEGGGVTEPVGNGYQRALLGESSGTKHMGTPEYDATAGKTTISNTSEIHFNEATGSWGTLTHFAIYGSKTGGTPLYVGQLNTSLTPVENNVVIIKVGDLRISIE